jgi:hypothetical protein
MLKLTRSIFLLLLPAILLASCTASPTSRLAAADQAYTLTLNTLSDLRQFGYLDDDAARRVEQARLAADTTLNLIRLRIAEGSTVDPATWESLSNALAALIKERLLAEESKRERSTTRPIRTGDARERGHGPREQREGPDPSVAGGGSRPHAGRVGSNPREET